MLLAIPLLDWNAADLGYLTITSIPGQISLAGKLCFLASAS